MEVEETTPERYDIPGVYYASAEEVEENGAATAPRSEKGGAIYVGDGSTYTMSGGSFRSQTAAYGGAVYVASGGTFNMTGGTLMFNQAVCGGAIYVEAGGTVNLTGGSISGNAADIGSAIYMADGATINHGENFIISGNSSQLYDNYISFYIDGKFRTVAGIEEDGKFDLSTAPLDYEHCNGYFSDADLIHGVEDGDTIYTPSAVQSAAANNFETVRLYTKVATPEKLTFTLSGSEYNVKQVNTSTTTGEVVIPRQYNGKNVTSIEYLAFEYCSGLTSVTIPYSVTSIEYFAFAGCTGLTSITIPDSVTSIGNSAFSGCDSLISITIPNSVTRIGNKAFYGCTSLQYNEYDNAYYLGNGTNPYMVLIRAKNTSITGCEINENTHFIHNRAFVTCRGLTELTIPENVIIIDTEAFVGCNHLETINYNATNATITEIYPNLFSNAGTAGDGITVTIGNNVTTIPAYLFWYTTIDNYTPKITSVTIGSGVTSIGERAFEGCAWLTEITIPDSVTSIGAQAFHSCSGLASVTIGSGVTSIGSNAFYNCVNLTEINYNANISTAFKSSSNIFYQAGRSGNGIALTIGDNVTTIPNYLFFVANTVYGAKLTSITIPSSVTSIGIDAFNGSLSYVTTANVPYIAFEQEALPKDKITSLTINSGTIPNSAFLDNLTLTNLTLDGEVSIGNKAFRECTGLVSLTLGSGVTNIGNEAFLGCTHLETINYNATNATITSWSNAFYSAGAAGNGITVTFGDNVTSIPTCLFLADKSPKIVSVTIGSGMTSIGEAAFKNCTELATVTIDSSRIAGWNSSNSWLLTNATTVYVKETIGTVGSYITTRCQYQAESDKAGYKKYVWAMPSNLVVSSNTNSLPASKFAGQITLQTVTFEEGSTAILSANLFKDCTSLTTVTCASGQNEFWDSTFTNCPSLESVTIRNKAIITDFPADFSSISSNVYLMAGYDESLLDSVYLNITEYNLRASMTTLKSIANIAQYLGYGDMDVDVKIYKYSATNPGSSSSGVDGWWHYDANNKPVKW